MFCTHYFDARLKRMRLVTDNKVMKRIITLPLVTLTSSLFLACCNSTEGEVANAGADKTTTLPINSVILTGSATDAKGDAFSYACAKVSGGSATIA